MTLYLVCISPDPSFPASEELDRVSAEGIAEHCSTPSRHCIRELLHLSSAAFPE